jgi:hypothetical protein
LITVTLPETTDPVGALSGKEIATQARAFAGVDIVKLLGLLVADPPKLVTTQRN